MRKPSDGPWTLPKKFGNYELTARLGGGTLGELFRATRLEDGLVCEMRCFPQSFGKRMLRVLEEAKAVSKLRHPNIREVYEVGREKGVFFAALETIDTRTLEDALTDPDDPLDLGRGVEALATVARALHAAHEAGVVHGHLRPEHVLISLDDDADENYVKIENFGFEKLRTASMLVASGSVDRARFLAPEQAEESASFDARTDVYAVGAMLYRLVTGRFHVEGETIHQILRNIAEGDITPPGDVTTNLDGDVEAVILRSLAVNPDDRYTTAAALGQDLDRLAHGEKPRARDMGTPRTKRRTRGKSRASLLLVLLMLVVGGAAAAVWFVPALREPVLGRFLDGDGDAAVAAGDPAEEAVGPAGDGARTADPAAPGSNGRGTNVEAPEEDPPGETEPPPAVDPGKALRAKAAEHLIAGDANAAISLLTPYLDEQPEDAEALAQRGHANALRGELDRARADLDAAQQLTDGTDSPTAMRGRALLCWNVAKSTFENALRRRATVTDATWTELDCALQQADVLPKPVDVMVFVEPWIRGSRGVVKGWTAMVNDVVPEGLFRDYITVTDRLSEDPVPAEEAAVLAAARTRFPAWADPMVHEALRLRRTGSIADGRALLGLAAAADPGHPNVALAHTVFDTLDGKAGAMARGIDEWAKVRGNSMHAQRMFYFCLRDRLREADAPLDSAHCILTYLKEADAEAMPFVLSIFWPNIWKTLQTDLATFGGAPGDDPGADKLAYVIRNLTSAKPDTLLQHAEAALAEDRNERYASVLGMYLTRDKRGVMGPLNTRLQGWRTPLERVADQLLVAMAQQAARGDLNRAIGLVRQVFALVESDTHVRKAMRSFGMACLKNGTPEALAYFESVLKGWAEAPAHPVKPDALRWRARVYERRRDLPKAWAELDAALAAAGTREHDVRFWRAFLALRSGDSATAMEECSTVIEATPGTARAYLWRGLAELLEGMTDPAAADFAAAIAKGEKDPLCRVLAAQVALSKGDTAGALAHCEEAMGAEGAMIAEAWWVRGRIRKSQQRDNEALDDWADALTMTGSSWGADVPLSSLMRATMAVVNKSTRAIADRVMERASEALDAGDRTTASSWIRSLNRVRKARNQGRYLYLVARYNAPTTKDPMQVLGALEQSLEAGWRPDGEWGAETEFDGLRNSARFKELQASADRPRKK